MSGRETSTYSYDGWDIARHEKGGWGAWRDHQGQVLELRGKTQKALKEQIEVIHRGTFDHWVEAQRLRAALETIRQSARNARERAGMITMVTKLHDIERLAESVLGGNSAPANSSQSGLRPRSRK